MSGLSARYLPALQSPHVELRELAVTCLGLHCHASPRVAKTMFNLFASALQHDQPQVQMAALRATLDLMLLHSPAAILPARDDPAPAEADAKAAAAAAIAAGAPVPPEEDGCAAQVGALLTPLLQSASGALRTTAALGLCKLLHAGALRSSSLLARLLLVYFDTSAYAESTDAAARRDAAELSQSLAVFFAASGRAAGMAFALVPALRAVLHAPDGCADAEISIDALLNFSLAMLDEANHADGAGASSTQLALALALTCEALSTPQSRGAKLLPKAYAQLALPPIDDAGPDGHAALRALHGLLQQLCAGLDDKVALRHAAKMLERTEALIGEGSTPAGEAAGEAGEHGEEESADAAAKRVLDAHEALKAASEASEVARRQAAATAANGQEAPPSADSAAAAKGGGGAQPARRRLAKSKAGGLTPAKSVPAQAALENLAVNA